MSKRHRRRYAAAGVAFALTAMAVAAAVLMPAGSTTAAPVDGEGAPAIAKRLASLQQFSPGTGNSLEGEGGGWAAQDDVMRSLDGQGDGPPSFQAFATARNDWRGLLGRPAVGTGKWEPYGPVNGLNDLKNTFRDRSYYNAGTENFGGRTVHGVIDKKCTADECYFWVANANGGVWMTRNALATDNPATQPNEGPAWEYVSETFEMNNVSSLELDPNDPTGNTLWAGTGEPNACGSGCEIGVGVYLTRSAKSKSNGTYGWQGPLGEKYFFGRGVGSIEVKPGDSDTVFVATGRAIRGVSNTCCGGADALTPGAEHFGVYRTQDRGKTWELVHQGADALCTASTPDAVSNNMTACSARGARRVKIDPVDPNTVYASFFSRGIWRSRANGDPGTWEQIYGRIGTAAQTAERPEFDVVELPNGKTRMYVGVGVGDSSRTAAQYARFLRNDDVRDLPAAATQAGFVQMTDPTPNTERYSSFGYCDPQCSYDNYVYVPAADNPDAGISPDIVYLLGDNEYNENNHVTGRSNGRAVLLSTNGGVSFYDMTEDASNPNYPGAIHPDNHALVTNPSNWQQFFNMGDGGVIRSNGVFVNDSAQCSAPPKLIVDPARLAFCMGRLAQVPARLNAINAGFRTLHFYQLEYDRKNPDRLAGGTQDNGSWETIGDRENWLNINIADGGHQGFDPPGGDPQFALTAWQQNQIEVRYNPQDQMDVQWVADTLWGPYASEWYAFIGPAIVDPVTPGWLWTGREHVFRSTNWGRNPAFATKEAHRANCNVYYGAFGDVNGDNEYDSRDFCDDFKPLGDPGPNGRLTSPTYGADKIAAAASANWVSVVERAPSDVNTLWAATSAGRIFVSKNANDPNPATVVFDRIDNDPTALNSPARYPTSIFVDRTNPNHAWITYSGYNSKDPTHPGHVFEVFYVPNASKFVVLDGHKINGFGDIPATSVIVTKRGTLYVGTDYGVVVKEPKSDVWKMAPAGLPNMNVPDLVYIPEKDGLFAATHGQGVWFLKVQ